MMLVVGEGNTSWRLCAHIAGPARSYVICVGAVGYARDGLSALRYAIYDDEQDKVTFRRCEGPLLDLMDL